MKGLGNIPVKAFGIEGLLDISSAAAPLQKPEEITRGFRGISQLVEYIGKEFSIVRSKQTRRIDPSNKALFLKKVQVELHSPQVVDGMETGEDDETGPLQFDFNRNASQYKQYVLPKRKIVQTTEYKMAECGNEGITTQGQLLPQIEKRTGFSRQNEQFNGSYKILSQERGASKGEMRSASVLSRKLKTRNGVERFENIEMQTFIQNDDNRCYENKSRVNRKSEHRTLEALEVCKGSSRKVKSQVYPAMISTIDNLHGSCKPKI